MVCQVFFSFIEKDSDGLTTKNKIRFENGHANTLITLALSLHLQHHLLYSPIPYHYISKLHCMTMSSIIILTRYTRILDLKTPNTTTTKSNQIISMCEYRVHCSNERNIVIN